ncbi:MAG: type II toxin-antitoxin system RelE/ParE family toxin [Acidobacteriia bacterium]|nr:type II toxin-antitoxin system RelE/ParE family toxin [Terriglobia bacterium]
MARRNRVPGEKLLFWVGSSKDDLLAFPDAVIEEMGTALSVAQFGGKHPKAKPWKGQGPGVFEIVEDHRGDTYRAAYQIAEKLKTPSFRGTLRAEESLFS